jgi:zona occludens toxin (predicted ATPase)
LCSIEFNKFACICYIQTRREGLLSAWIASKLNGQQNKLLIYRWGIVMTEGLFVLTTLFVAYVIYVIVNEKKAGGAATKSTVAAATQPKPQASVAEKPAATVIKPKPAPAAKPAVAKPAAVAKKPVVAVAPKPAPVAAPKPVVATAPKPAAAVAAPEAIKGTGLKDPKTGEIATTYSNYRFTKRWIKEALVAEKLVDKVYKNDELNAGVEAKIKAGLAKLEGMKKYKP